MWRKYLISLSLLIALTIGAGASLAQDGTTTTTVTDSSVNIFVVICETQAVVNLSGGLTSNRELYYQIFSGPQGTGTALTTLRRVSVTGAYTFSEVVPYAGGTVPAATIGSAYVAITRVGAPDSPTFSTFVDDIQDGCASPQNVVGASTDTGANAVTSTTTTSTPENPILSPFGGFLNPGYTPPPQPLVVIGAREDLETPRQATPGLIFAECESYRIAEPGIVFDTDDVIIFWSWYARTAQQVQDHIDHANYSVAYYGEVPPPNVQRSQIVKRGSTYWVFYTSHLGNLNPAAYNIYYSVSWNNPITDGYGDYGPGTETEELRSGCHFIVSPNPDHVVIPHNNWPFGFLSNG
jgi:hypothetical protein